ncbi:hypothetical protein MB46_10445 [Arthrobacter alpinus]|uniref:peptidoglycan DD-metalloendopeptidase family protein n=1 Tax=Arthrobacter alpinus TaxID=656366 RepID=UPI000678D60A|nr:peptidoglycan DD-metalloendopeptidase family protein [Arthrobacter alpinus]ALV45840.1 hypothetical protein MB46_10445 [Arthrobacter alpinus]
MARYIWPVDPGISINQAFGSSPGGVNPSGGHTGMDFGTPPGTPVYAPADGVIEYAQWFTTDNGVGNPYWLTSGGGISIVLGCDGDDAPSFVFSHLSGTQKNPGDRVRQGDVIGYTGNTGKWTTGPHLHFEAIPPGFNLNNSNYGRVNPGRYCTGFRNTTPPPAPPKPTPTPAPPVQKDWFDMASTNDLKNALREVIKEPAILDLIALAFLQRDCYLVDPTAKTTAITGSTTLAKKINWAAYNNAKLLTILVAIAGNLGIATELIEDLPETLAAQLSAEAGSVVETAPAEVDK